MKRELQNNNDVCVVVTLYFIFFLCLVRCFPIEGNLVTKATTQTHTNTEVAIRRGHSGDGGDGE